MPEKILADAGYNCIVKGRYGYLLYNKNDIYVGRSIEKYGEFSEGEVALFRQICGPGDFVIDAGANIGAHTLAFSRLVGNTGRVFAYEPQRMVFQVLCANMAINSIENVECYQMGLSSKISTTRIPDIRYDLEANHGGFRMESFSSGIRIPVSTIDSLHDLPRLKFIKIDVEGMENQVIQGAAATISKHRPFLYVENDKLEHSEDLIKRIMELDYRLFWHLPPLFNPENFAGDKENIFGEIISFNMLCFHRSLNLNLEGFQEITEPGFHPLKK